MAEACPLVCTHHVFLVHLWIYGYFMHMHVPQMRKQTPQVTLLFQLKSQQETVNCSEVHTAWLGPGYEFLVGDTIAAAKTSRWASDEQNPEARAPVPVAVSLNTGAQGL